jgi:hypothetical protein
VNRWVTLAYSLGLVGAGFALGRGSCAEGPVAQPVRPAPEVRQADGSLVLERAPAAPEAVERELPALPKEHVATRVVRVALQPKQAGCEPVEATLVVAKAPDGSSRVVVDSPNARILAGKDVPLAADLTPAVARRLAVGIAARFTGRDGQAAVGPFVDYDVGRLRLGAAVLLDPLGRVELLAKAGWTF